MTLPPDAWGEVTGLFHAQVSSRLPIRAHIGHGSKRRISVAGPAGIAKYFVVESSAALIPQIFSGCQLQPVNVAAHNNPLDRLIDSLDEGVLVVHQVVEREPRVDARRRQNLKERIVLVVRGIVIARAAKCTGPHPGGCRDLVPLVSTFDGIGSSSAGSVLPSCHSAALPRT